jgi:hypothetical protein
MFDQLDAPLAATAVPGLSGHGELRVLGPTLACTASSLEDLAEDD